MEKNRIQEQWSLVLIALAFFTRIPIPRSVNFSQQKLNRASRYFSLVGWSVGVMTAFVFWLSSQFLTSNIAIILSMIFSVLLTGCFHEDGLADTCDGFGGGWDKPQKLSIMKDSRLGTYGAVGIWFALSLKFLLLSQIQSVIMVLIAAHVVSRSFSTMMIYYLPYVTDEGQSKVKPLAEKLNKKDLIINLCFGFTSLIFVLDIAVLILVVLLLLFLILKRLYQDQIGGFTGDTLGAAQQISEIVVYLIVLAAAPISGAVI